MNRRNYKSTLAAAGLAGLGPIATDASYVTEVLVPEQQSDTNTVQLVETLQLNHMYVLAGHSSHSSHGSHGSHRSHRSGATTPARRVPAPLPTPPSRNPTSTPPSSVLPLSPYLASRLSATEYEEHVEVVRKVQAVLWIGKYYTGELDALPGPETKAAIAKYQADKKLDVSGRITHDLIQAMGLDLKEIFDEKTYLKVLPGNSKKFKHIVRQVQVILFLYGYYTDTIDGVIGESTRKAIRQFQKDYSVPATGTLTTPTLNVLRVTAE